MGNQCMHCLDVDEFNKEIFIEGGIVLDTENSLQLEIEKESLISIEQKQQKQQKGLFHYFTQSYLKEMFDNFELFSDQLKDLKNQKECKIYQEKSKFDQNTQCFWCQFVEQEKSDNKIHQYFIENQVDFTPDMLTLFNMNMDENIQKKVNDQLESYEIVNIEKNDKYVIILTKQKTIKSFLNSSKYFFVVTIYKKNLQNQFQRISTSVQFTELFKDEYYKKLSDELNPQMLTIMNIQQYQQIDKITQITDVSKVDPLNQVGLRLAKGFMKKVFKKYNEEYKKQLVEFIIEQKKKGLDENLLWFNNDKKEIKKIIKENFDIIKNTKIKIESLSEETKILYNNKSMINSDLLNSDGLSDMEEIKNSKTQFSIFDYPQIQENNKINDLKIDDNLSPIKPTQNDKKKHDQNIIKFFKEDLDQKVDDNHTPFSIRESDIISETQKKTVDFPNQKDQESILQNSQNQNDSQIDIKEENFNPKIEQEDQTQNIVENQKILNLEKQKSDIQKEELEQNEQFLEVSKNSIEKDNLQDSQKIQDIFNQKEEQKIQDFSDLQQESQNNLQEAQKDKEEVHSQDNIQQNQNQTESEKLEQENQQNQIQQQQILSEEQIKSEKETIKNSSKIEQDKNKKVQDEKSFDKQENEQIINDSFLSCQSNEKIEVVNQPQDDDQNIQQYAQSFVENILENAIKKIQIENLKEEDKKFESTNLNSIQNQNNENNQKRLQQDIELVDKQNSFEDIDLEQINLQFQYAN